MTFISNNNRFATVYQMKPQWRMKEYFVVDVVHFALFMDVRYSFIPLTAHADSSGEIEFVFGPLAYYKGNMLKIFW